MATIVDVAKKAGVSVSTVSYALSGVRPVSEATRQTVMRAVEELNYHPNLLARGLINKRTRIIALLYPAVSSDYLDDEQLDFIASIAKIATFYDYGLLLFTSPSGEEEISRFINQGLVDGLILMEVKRQDPRVALMKQLGYPFSLIGHSEVNEGVNFVDADFFAALELSVQHLVRLNHRQMAFLPRVADYENTEYNYQLEALRGFKSAVAEAGVQGTIVGCEPTALSGYEATMDLLHRQPGISAIIAGNEPIYVGVTQALEEKGLRIPKDISVVGIMPDRSAVKYTPKVTHVSIPSIEMGRLGAEFLIQQLEDKSIEPKQVILPPQFIPRQSTARYKKPA